MKTVLDYENITISLSVSEDPVQFERVDTKKSCHGSLSSMYSIITWMLLFKPSKKRCGIVHCALWVSKLGGEETYGIPYKDSLSVDYWTKSDGVFEVQIISERFIFLKPYLEYM